MLQSKLSNATSNKTKQLVKDCQVNTSQLVKTSDFGSRLRAAFNGAKNAEIARQLHISEAAVTNYIDGRVPKLEILLQVSDLTGCSVHWLITGEGEQFVNSQTAVTFDQIFEDKINLLINNFLTSGNLNRTFENQLREIIRSEIEIDRSFLKKGLTPAEVIRVENHIETTDEQMEELTPAKKA